MAGPEGVVAIRRLVEEVCQIAAQPERPVGRLAGDDAAVDIDVLGRDRDGPAENLGAGRAARQVSFAVVHFGVQGFTLDHGNVRILQFGNGDRPADRAERIGHLGRILVAKAAAVINVAVVAPQRGAGLVHEAAVEGVVGVVVPRPFFGAGNESDGQVGARRGDRWIAARPDHALLPLGIRIRACVKRLVAGHVDGVRAPGRGQVHLLAKDLAGLADRPHQVADAHCSAQIVDRTHQHHCRAIQVALHGGAEAVVEDDDWCAILARFGQRHVARRGTPGGAREQDLAARGIGNRGGTDHQVVRAVVDDFDFRCAMRDELPAAAQVAGVDGNGTAGGVQRAELDGANRRGRHAGEHRIARGGRLEVVFDIGTAVEPALESGGRRCTVGRNIDLAAKDARILTVGNHDGQVVIDAGVDRTIHHHARAGRRAHGALAGRDGNEAERETTSGAVGGRNRAALVGANGRVLGALHRGAGVDGEAGVAPQVGRGRRFRHGDQAVDVGLAAGVTGQ